MGALKITGQSAEPTVTGSDAGMIYYDSTANNLKVYNGTNWQLLNEPAYGGEISPYASGGTTYRIHAFLTSGLFSVEKTLTADILIVAGGGSGAHSYACGGGAGGLIYQSGRTITAGVYTLEIGAGGVKAAGKQIVGNVGGDSTFASTSATLLTAKGGGYGGKESTAAGDGGSGGGAGHDVDGKGDGIQTTGSPVGDSRTYGFGNEGGNGVEHPNYNSGGGGGAGGAGGPGGVNESGSGGTGRDYSTIFGTTYGESGWFASGGGGGWVADGNSGGGTASAGGGGAGSAANTAVATAGQANTGGGGGGTSLGVAADSAVAGGSGVIIIRYVI